MYDAHAAVVILNVPAPYAKGDDYPGIEFAIHKKSKNQPRTSIMTGLVTAESEEPDSAGRKPITLVKVVELEMDQVIVYAYWKSIHKSECVNDWGGSTTLTAILADGLFPGIPFV